MALRKDLEFKQGTNDPLGITWTVSSTGVPVDVANSTVLMQLRSDPSADEDPDFTAGTGDGKVTLGDEEGTLLIECDMTDVEPGRYEYDVIITLPGADPVCLMFGFADVLRLVSRL